MGYYVYITKADHPLGSKDKPITTAEWKSAVKSDPSLMFDGRGTRSVVWVDDLGDEQGRMVFGNGRVLAKNPSDEMIQKMKALARLLAANVLGDDGKLYS
jgi:hypothetical protein